MARAHRPLVAFTLIELLVVIAIIALLIGILLPGLGKARETGRSLKELASISNVAKVNAAYSMDFQDEVIPARIPKYWVWWQVCHTQMYPADPHDKSIRMTHDSMRTWPWRLIGYSNTQVEDFWCISKYDLELFKSRGVTGRTVANNLATYPDTTFVGALSEHPSFAMNSVFYGGDTNFSAFKRHGMSTCGWDTILTGTNSAINGGNFYVTKSSNVRFPSNMITFAGARGGDVSGTGYHNNGRNAADSLTQMRDGYYRVLAPTNLPASDPDHGTGFNLVAGWTNTGNVYNSRANQSSWGFLNARYFSTVATTRADASAKRMKIEEFRDMKVWDNFAPENTNGAGVYAWRAR